MLEQADTESTCDTVSRFSLTLKQYKRTFKGKIWIQQRSLDTYEES